MSDHNDIKIVLRDVPLDIYQNVSFEYVKKVFLKGSSMDWNVIFIKIY